MATSKKVAVNVLQNCLEIATGAGPHVEATAFEKLLTWLQVKHANLGLLIKLYCFDWPWFLFVASDRSGTSH